MPSSILNSDDGVISGTSGLKSSGGDDAVLLIQTKGTTAQTIDAGQRTKFPTTIGVGNATPSTSGSGISFPATQSASTDANTLDDYEEGTFTPTIAGSSSDGTASYSPQVGKYTKIGNFVTCDFHINYSGGTGTGNLLIKGLPFTTANDNSFPSGSFLFSNISFTSGAVPVNYAAPNSTTITFEQVSGGATTAISYDAAGVILGSFAYRV